MESEVKLDRTIVEYVPEVLGKARSSPASYYVLSF